MPIILKQQKYWEDKIPTCSLFKELCLLTQNFTANNGLIQINMALYIILLLGPIQIIYAALTYFGQHNLKKKSTTSFCIKGKNHKILESTNANWKIM